MSTPIQTAAEAAFAKRGTPAPPVDHKRVTRVWWISPYQHAEAFAVMLYASKDRKVTEFLWNSRDGVTPFGIRSQDGSVDLLHDAWDYDVCVPDYVPAIGMRVFVDLTREAAQALSVDYVEKYWEGDMDAKPLPLPGMKGMFPTKEIAIESMIANWLGLDRPRGLGGEGKPEGQPHVITVDADWLLKLQLSRA